jgi:hypothetical protein
MHSLRIDSTNSVKEAQLASLQSLDSNFWMCNRCQPNRDFFINSDFCTFKHIPLHSTTRPSEELTITTVNTNMKITNTMMMYTCIDRLQLAVNERSLRWKSIWQNHILLNKLKIVLGILEKFISTVTVFSWQKFRGPVHAE